MNSIPFPFRRTVLAGSVLGLLGITLTADAAGMGRAPRASAHLVPRNFAMVSLASDALRPAEQSFLTKAVESSRQQIRLAEVGAGNADRTEVRSHALQLVADYRGLVDTLDALIRRKGGIAGAPVGTTSENYQKLTEKSGADFDREFVRVAAELSSRVMALFEQAAADARDADVRELAANQLPLLRTHQNQVNELKKSLI